MWNLFNVQFFPQTKLYSSLNTPYEIQPYTDSNYSVCLVAATKLSYVWKMQNATYLSLHLFSCLFALHLPLESCIIFYRAVGTWGWRDAHVTKILETMGAKPFTWNYPLFVFAHPPPHILDFLTPLVMIKSRFVRVSSFEGMISIVSISKKEGGKS